MLPKGLNQRYKNCYSATPWIILTASPRLCWAMAICFLTASGGAILDEKLENKIKACIIILAYLWNKW